MPVQSWEKPQDELLKDILKKLKDISNQQDQLEKGLQWVKGMVKMVGRFARSTMVVGEDTLESLEAMQGMDAMLRFYGEQLPRNKGMEEGPSHLGWVKKDKGKGKAREESEEEDQQSVALGEDKEDEQ